MDDPRFHWDSFLFGVCISISLHFALADYMPAPMVLPSSTKLILGIAGTGVSILLFIHMLHKPRIIPPKDQ